MSTFFEEAALHRNLHAPVFGSYSMQYMEYMSGVYFYRYLKWTLGLDMVGSFITIRKCEKYISICRQLVSQTTISLYFPSPMEIGRAHV